jgi:hypothetical protein
MIIYGYVNYISYLILSIYNSAPYNIIGVSFLKSIIDLLKSVDLTKKNDKY